MELDINDIRKILPHRYPFLLVDKILEIEIGKRAVGLKNVTANEEFFQGHFPEYPVMPGVLVIEAIAQVGAVTLLSKEEYKGKLVFFAGIDKARIRKQVLPGDQLIIEVEVIKMKGSIGKAKGVVKVKDKIAVEAEIMFAIEK